MEKVINIAVLWLLTPEGKKLTGGMERWCWDLANLAVKKGFLVNIYQKANKSFYIKYSKDINIIGVKSSLSFIGNLKFSSWLNKNLDKNQTIIFVSQELAILSKFSNSIAINHGIWWDGDFPLIKKALNKVLQKRLINKVKRTICVDTNYINWCHTELSKRKSWASKLAYLPNYSDLTQFQFKDLKSSSGTKTILYPRRLTGNEIENNPRGIGFFLETIKILEKKNLIFNYVFVGRGELTEILKSRLKEFGIPDSRYEVKEVSFEDMPREYEKADIVVIPTIAHEGTSLSAIEGIVSGVPTVVTHIGGLGNLVIDGYNGYISDLDPMTFVEKIEQAIKNSHILNSNAKNMREYYSIQNWEYKVWQVINTLRK